jgi:hypothetical protein
MPETRSKRNPVGLEVTGTLVALFVVITLLAGVVASIKVFRARVALRVPGKLDPAKDS